MAAPAGHFWSATDGEGHEIWVNEGGYWGGNIGGYELLARDDLVEAQAYVATGCPYPEPGPRPDARIIDGRQ